MVMEIEQVIQICSILAFVGGAFLFFEKAGEVKNSALKDIENIQEEIKEIHKKDIEQDKKIDEIDDKNTCAINRLEGLLIEVKTTLEFFIRNGFNNDGTKKD
ncbi:MAG: hypothetical protein DKM23_00020 [Candidatus Melainabacteria bacterium]|nr:MAG: hypothetical protein DKM23_00020 [Candidatus Melainabacteria bacterium]